ncbi:hypothetical protein [Brachybacterium sp. NPDC056505]|jgi:hypothetical protein|uniref:hypothetical protein n=1 Tax=Brachybacterium sp. NPDC056505 TaxID=3345843 RepID=UPI003672451A
MTGVPDKKQTIAIAEADRQALRGEAAERGVGTGLFARAGLIYALERADDPALQLVVEQEAEAEKARITAAARAAVKERWKK